MSVAALKTWALKNRPVNGKGIIQDEEIISQTSYAYNRPYSGYACDDAAIRPFCEPTCSVNQWRERRALGARENVSEVLRAGKGDETKISPDG